MVSEKNLHHFCFWHPPLFNFYIVILLPVTKEIFLPDGLKRFLTPARQPSDYIGLIAYQLLGMDLVKIQHKV